MKRILIVIPAFNEEKIIADNLKTLSNFASENLAGYDFQIIVADNNSQDQTAQRVQELARLDSKVNYLFYAQKGKGLAVLRTWQKYQDDFDIFIFMDADLSTDLSALPLLVKNIENGFDIAVGSRGLKKSTVKKSALRRLFSFGYKMITKIFLDTKINDFACGFKAVNKKVVNEIVPKIKSHQYFFDTEMLYLAERANLNVLELPVKWEETREDSKVNLFRVSRAYFKEVLRLRRENNPYKMSKGEKIFVWLASLILIVITGIPYLYGYWIAGNLFFTGSHIFSPGDTPVYFSFIEQIKQGNILLDNLFSNDLAGPYLFNPFWLLVGLASRFLNLSAPLAYHLFRVILTPIFLFSLYKIISFFLDGFSEKKKKFCFVYSIFASGLGGLACLFSSADMLHGANFNLAMDMWVPESSNFLIIFNSPHFIASITLIILTFYFFFLSLEKNKIKYAALAGFFALILFSFHPFYVPTIYLISLLCVLFLFISHRKIIFNFLASYFLLVLISLPSVIYYIYLLFINELLRLKAAQNICLTPGGSIFFVSYGLGLFFAIFAAVVLFERGKITNKSIFLIVWFWSSIALIYFPFNFQRRLTEGLQIPLTILAFIGLCFIYETIKTKLLSLGKNFLYFILPFFILFFCLTNFIVYFGDFDFFNLKSEITFINQDMKSALDWYEARTDFSQTILASGIDGNLIPGVIGRRVFLGHSVETIDYEAKLKELKYFFKSNGNDDIKYAFLKNNRIDYIFYSESEKNMGTFNPQTKSYLEKVYGNDSVLIFKVK